MGRIEYKANNSGGGWWLSDENWLALEKAGWVVHWVHDWEDPSHDHQWDEKEAEYRREHGRPGSDWNPYDLKHRQFGDHRHAYDDEFVLVPVRWNGERYLGARANSAAKETNDPKAAVAEFERVTGQNASDEGCNCCGSPHSFEFTDDEGKSQSTYVEVTGTELVWS